MGFIIKAIGSVFKAIGSVFKGIFSIFGHGKPKIPNNSATNARLNKTLDPNEPRKIVFGQTASALDQRYWEVFGSNRDRFDEVIAIASHTIEGYLDLWLEDIRVIDASGNVTGSYTDANGKVQPGYQGVLTRTTNDGTQAPLSVGTGSGWNANSKFTGVAHMALHWIVDDKKLPNGLPTRLTQRIKGAKVYDPRRDSTRGGSGTHRADDQTTWEYAPTDSNGVPIGRNNALQILWYLIGWRITSPQTSEKILVCGRGVDLNDIDFNQFIAAANACEAAQYYTDCILSTGDSHATNESVLSADGLIGRVLDVGGLWGYFPNVDDTATISVDITDDDIADIGSIEWNEFSLPLSESYNSVGGSFVDPSDTALYKTRPYPLVRDTSYEAADGFKRSGKKDFQSVQDVALAQKLARLMVNAARYQGVFTGTFKHRVLAAQAWSVVRYTSERFGWTKLFRVTSMGITMGGGIDLHLREVNPAIWTAGVVNTSPPPALGYRNNPRTTYDPAAVTISSTTFTGANGTVLDGATVTWGAVPNGVRSIEVRYRVSGALNWNYAVQQTQDGSTAGNLGPLISGTTYEINVRFVSNYGIPGNWIAPASNFVAGSFSNVFDGRVGAGLNSSGQVLSAAIGDANRVRFSQMERGIRGWLYPENSGVTSPASTTVMSGGVAYFKSTAVFTANSQYLSIGSDTGIAGCAYPCTPGERLFVGAMLGTDSNLPAGAYWDYSIAWLNSSGTEVGLSRATVASGSGPISPYARFGGFVTVPANAVSCFVRLHVYNQTTGFTGATGIYLGQPMICSAGANQTTWPSFTPGPGTDLGATLGAAWGVNLTSTPTNLTNLTGTEGIVNSLISIGINGAIAGAGGGQVTIGGLGYSGALNATYGATWGSNVGSVPTNLGALAGTEDIRNDYMDLTQDFGGTGGRLRLRATSRGTGVGAYQLLDDRVQNYGITVNSGLLNGIGTGTGTAVGNSLVSIGANGALAGAGGGQANIYAMGAAFGYNLVVNSEMTLMDPLWSTTVPAGFTPGWLGNNVPQPSVVDARVTLADGTYGFGRTCTGAMTSGNSIDAIIQRVTGALGSRFMVPVKPGDTVALGALIAHQNCTGGYVEAQWVDETYNYVGEVGGSSAGYDIGGAAFTSISRKDMPRSTLICVVPPDNDSTLSNTKRVRYCSLNIRFASNGTANPRLLIAEPFLAKVPTGQTAMPAYTPGPGDRSATYGAVAGTNLVDESNAVMASPTIKNSNVGAYASLGDANRVRFSLMERGTYGWQSCDQVGVSAPAIVSSSANGVPYVQVSQSFTGNGQQFAIGSTGPTYFPVVAGEKLFVGSVIGFSGGTGFGAGHSCFMAIGWVDSNGVETATRTTVQSASGYQAYPTRIGGFVTVPAGAVQGFLRLYADSNNAGAASTVWLTMGQPLVCGAGASQAAWPSFTPGPSGDAGATLGADWSGNVTSRPTNLQALTGSEGIQNTLLSIGSNGALAGGGGGQVTANGLGVAMGANVLQNTDFALPSLAQNAYTVDNTGNLFGWWTITGSAQGSNGAVTTAGVNLTGYFGQTNVAYTSMSGTPANGTYFHSHWHTPNTNVTSLQRWGLQVVPGDSVFYSCLLARHRCDAYLVIFFYDGSGNYVNEVGGSLGQGTLSGAANGDPTSMTRCGVIATAPTNARYAVASVRGMCDGSAYPYLFYTQIMLCKLPAGQTVWPPYNSGARPSNPLQFAGSGARLGDSRNIPPVQAAGGRYYYNQSPTYTAAAGTPATATISVPAGTVTVGSQSISYGAASVNVTGTNGATVSYYLYIDDANWAGGTATLNATTDSTVPYKNDGRIYLGGIDVTYPTSGTGTGTGKPGGGGSYGCVSEDALVWTLRGQIPAREVVVGDWLVVLDYSTMEGLRFEQVTQNLVMPRKGWEIVTEGARLELSEETPLTLRDGSGIMPCELAGQELPVIIDGEFSWQPCFAQPLGREINVCLISCNCQTYAAGMERDRMILTHNLQTYPKP